MMDDFFILPSLRRARGGAVVKFVEEFARDGGRVAKFLDVSVYGYFKCLGVNMLWWSLKDSCLACSSCRSRQGGLHLH